MSDTPTSFRGTPPAEKVLKDRLAEKLPYWNSLVETGRELDGIWRWMYSDATNTWSFRSYLPGDRFLMALSLTETGFEASLNLKAAEWEWITAADPDEQAHIDGLQAKAIKSGDEPAWIHVDIDGEAVLPMFAKLIFARSKRVQNTKAKKKRR